MNTKTETQPVRFSKPSQIFAAWGLPVGRRLIPIAIVIAGWLTLRAFRDRSAENLQNEAFVTGYSLAAICIFLMLLGCSQASCYDSSRAIGGLAKVTPLSRAAERRCLCSSFGLFTTGWLESLLALSFWAIAVTGLIGWYVNRTAPKMLRAAGPPDSTARHSSKVEADREGCLRDRSHGCRQKRYRSLSGSLPRKLEFLFQHAARMDLPNSAKWRKAS